MFECIKNSEYILIKPKNKNELHNLISKEKAKNKKIAVLGSNNEVNRAALDNKDVFMLLSPELERKRDYMKYRDSGLNQVLCKIANKTNVAIGIDFDEILKIKDKKEKAMRIGRIIQNIRLCKKYKVRVIMVSDKKNVSDLRSFSRTIGID